MIELVGEETRHSGHSQKTQRSPATDVGLKPRPGLMCQASGKAQVWHTEMSFTIYKAIHLTQDICKGSKFPQSRQGTSMGGGRNARPLLSLMGEAASH